MLRIETDSLAPVKSLRAHLHTRAGVNNKLSKGSDYRLKLLQVKVFHLQCNKMICLLCNFSQDLFSSFQASYPLRAPRCGERAERGGDAGTQLQHGF